MSELGQFALRLGLFLSGYAILVDLLGSWRDRRELLRSGRNATAGALLCLTVSCVALLILLARSDFAVQYVAENTSRALPFVYKLTALWAGAAGSLLLWLWLQTGFVVLAFSKSDSSSERFCAAARAAANLVAVFFFLVLLFDKDPFALSVATPSDGAGLNPLLQHPAMVLHPPALFLGYAAFAIPYAWTFAALRRDDLSRPPIFFRLARLWSVFAWMFLTVGIALGAWWAYEELGWGGYWAWDPVENSSLIPWLTATALLHCARTYRPDGRTGVWFMVLSIATFGLCIFGTFLTRYGLATSVHAFPDPGLGILFLVLVALIGAIGGVLFLRWRLRRKSVVETGARGVRLVIWNNWLMVLLAFVILVGTLFPFFSGLFSKDKISLKSEYFTKITAPLGLALLLLLGICPHLIREGFGRTWRTLGAIITAVAAVLIWALADGLAIAYLVACAFVGVNLVVDFVQRYARRGAPAQALSGQKNQARAGVGTTPGIRWLGARIVHVGVLLAFVGIAGSGGFDIEKQVALKPGQQVRVGSFDLTYNDLDAEHGPNFTAVKANISVSRGQKQIDKLSPAVAYYPQSEKSTSEVKIRRTLAGDLYLALGEVDNATKLINLTVFIKPLINWIWIGSTLMVLGTVLVLAAGLGRERGVPAGDAVVEK
jgi:cytochrome c-type biogenesis protein CcmF